MATLACLSASLDASSTPSSLVYSVTVLIKSKAYRLRHSTGGGASALGCAQLRCPCLNQLPLALTRIAGLPQALLRCGSLIRRLDLQSAMISIVPCAGKLS